ncbi:MAG: RyR domain-containing protein [Bacteroidales bacterium]|nr:RyR domain-containing protein [Bacteroidales bacterium]
MGNKNRILVTGDVTRDHYFRLGQRFYSDSSASISGTSYSWINGGAGLVHQFLTAFHPKENADFGLDLKIFDHLPTQNNSYATVSEFIEGKEIKEKRWRISGQFGFGKMEGTIDYNTFHPLSTIEGYDMVILDDAGMSFGSQINEKKTWSFLSELKKEDGVNVPRVIICKKSGDLQKGDLWKELLELSNQDKIKLITVVSVNDIRKLEARVSRGISWEQSALDLIHELHTKIALSGLLKSRILVVTFGSSGAILVCRKSNNQEVSRIFFEPDSLEGETEARYPGTMIGCMSCFTAAFAASLDLSNPNKDYFADEAAIKGLASVRGFYETGYKPIDDTIHLPLDQIVNATDKNILNYTSAFIPPFIEPSRYLQTPWTIMMGNHIDPSFSSSKFPGPMFELARMVVTQGRWVLNNVPSVSMGNLFTVDRNEIEEFRNIKLLIEQYREKRDVKVPLSIAVFGMPGSGKSFSVKQIGKGVLGKDVPILEFNLSQFDGAADLIGAFHQVRDEVLKGSTPLVFWDEFDSKKYFWLQYLLAPMQDGTFQEGQVTHTIGKCIMVFAGGTSYKMEFFGEFDGDRIKEDDFKLMKGPDFKSRINGYINIIGPNPGLYYNKATKAWEVDPGDRCFPVRRALFIRSILGLKDNEALSIDWGLLNALIKVDKFKHGSRSLENILKYLKYSANGKPILRSGLPSNSIISLMVENKERFLGLLNENLIDEEHAFAIAEAIHCAYLDHAKTMNPDYAKEFNMLPVFIKASNVAAALRIPKVLAKARLRMAEKGHSDSLSKLDYETVVNKDSRKILEKMSAEEHQLWMEFYDQNDWKYSENRIDYLKLHNCLVPYNDPRLNESEKDKDRSQVLKYWGILDKAGFCIVPE